MKHVSGRVVTAGILHRLRDALLEGEPKTYRQLAEHAGCTVRSVRNYLSHAEELFGFPVHKSRRPGSREVLVSAAPAPSPSSTRSPSSLPRVRNLLGDAMMQAVFPSTQPENASTPASFALLVGWPSYVPRHAALLETWLEACLRDPWNPLRLLLSGHQSTGETVLWPVAAIIHHKDGIVLVGAPLVSRGSFELHAISLARLADVPHAISLADDHVARPPHSREKLAASIPNDPRLLFGASSDQAQLVDMHLRFRPEAAQDAATRVWSPRQRVVFRRDGSMDLSVPDVPLPWAASVASSFGESVEVLGDKKLRKAVKKRRFSL